MQDFIDGLASMDGQEIGMVVALATHLRHEMEGAGIRLMDPIVDVSIAPDIPLRINRMIQACQKAGDLNGAAALMVWLHSARVGARHELRQAARDMWRQLERGFPHAERASIDLMLITSKPIRLSGFDDFPKGLTPDPV